MIQTETTKAKILLVEVPSVKEYWTNNNFLHIGEIYGDAHSIVLPQGNWTILNTLDEVTEDEAATLMPTHYDFITDEDYYWHKDEFSPVMTKTAKGCIKSLATSLGVQGKTIILYELK